MTTKRYRFVGQHLDDLADGRILEPGQFVDLTPDEAGHPHNAQHLDTGNLIPLDDPPRTTAKAGEK